MLKSILRYFAKRSHNVQAQMAIATVYGLIDIFGLGGTLAIIMKSRKMFNAKMARNRVTVQSRKVGQ